jgi:ketosteroid isomerase-like protein
MERSVEIEDFVRAWFGAASAGDASFVDRHVSASDAVRLVGSDPEEWLHGAGAVRDFLRGEVEGGGGHATFTATDTEGYASGDVGWAATKLTIALPDGRRVSPRWTAVFVREDGDWKFVQTHASIAVPNAEIGWSYEGEHS